LTKTAVLLARYKFAEEGVGLSLAEQSKLLDYLKDEQPISYRVSDPNPDDYNTYVIAPRIGNRLGERYLTWQVCRDIAFRQVRRPDRKNQTVKFDFEDTDDCELARIIAIPRLGVLAVEDGTGDGRLGGWSALRRFERIVATYTDAMFEAEAAGTPQDLKRAIDTWEIEKFDFQARPFNPHPSNPGQLLSDLLQRDGVGELRASAFPKEGAYIKPQEEGIVQEALGLAEKGYATYGARGRTRTGAEAIVKKPKFSRSRQENIDNLSGPQQLRVYVSAEREEDGVRKVVDVLIDFFDTDGPKRS
jgi:hypothetical protein